MVSAVLFENFRPIIGEESIQYTNGDEGKLRHSAYAKYFSGTSVKGNIGIMNQVCPEHTGNYEWLVIMCASICCKKCNMSTVHVKYTG